MIQIHSHADKIFSGKFAQRPNKFEVMKITTSFFTVICLRLRKEQHLLEISKHSKGEYVYEASAHVVHTYVYIARQIERLITNILT